MYRKQYYLIVDRLDFYYMGHKDGFADFTKDIFQAKKFWNLDMAEMNCRSLGVGFRVVAIDKE